MGEAAPKKGLPAGLIAGLAAAALVAGSVAGYLGLCAWVRDNDQLLPGAVAVDDRGEAVADLGKLTREDALAVVTGEMGQRLDSRKLTLLYGEGKRAELTGELMACSPETAVDVGFHAKEGQPFWKLGALWLGVAREPTDLSLSAAAFTPEGELEAKRVIQSIADELYREPVDFTYELGEEDVTVIPGTDGQRVDTEALLEDVEDALAQGETELTVEPEVLPSAELSGESLNKLIRVEPKAAGVDENGKLTPAVIGLSVNAREAQSILDETEPGQPCTIPLEFTPPGTTGDESLYYKDLLASVTTNMDGVASRSFNVRRAASVVNDTVLQPGEVFSYLGAIGDPSAANGYKTSTGYENGQTVVMDGGGVCQVSSSLYYCAVYANLEIVRRANHAFATGYIPNGLDATVYYPGLDFKFRNNTGFPVKIVTFTEGGDAGKLTVQFYGSNPDDLKVETERYTLSSTPWETVYKPDENIARGTTKVEVTPYTGYVVDVYRCVYDADGNQISRTFENHSTYGKRDKVILYNPLDSGPWGEGAASETVDLPSVPGVAPGTAVDPAPSAEPAPGVDPWPAEPTPGVDPWPVEPTPGVNPWPAEPGPAAEPSPEPTPTQYVDLPPIDETMPPWLSP